MIIKKLTLLFVLLCFPIVLNADTKNYPVLNKFPEGSFYLKNVASGKYLMSFKGKLVVHAKQGLPGQLWTVPHILSDGRGWIKQTEDEAIGGAGAKGHFRGDQAIVSKKYKQLANFLMLDNSTFVIKLVDDLVLHEKGGEKKKKDGTGVIWYPYKGSKNQQWKIILMNNEEYNPNRLVLKKKIDVPQPAIPEFFIKNQKFEYSAQGNFVYYKAKGTAEVTKIEGDVAYVTVNISESEGEGEKGIEKKGKSTFEAKITRKGDTYFIDKEKNGDMASSGKVDPSGLYLSFSDEGGGKTFKAVK